MDPRRTEVDGHVERPVGEHPTADPLPRLDHPDAHARVGEHPGRAETGEPCAHDAHRAPVPGGQHLAGGAPSAAQRAVGGGRRVDIGVLPGEEETIADRRLEAGDERADEPRRGSRGAAGNPGAPGQGPGRHERGRAEARGEEPPSGYGAHRVSSGVG